MGKESAYYNALDQKRRRETNNLKKMLPQHPRSLPRSADLQIELFMVTRHLLEEHIHSNNHQAYNVCPHNFPHA